MALDTCDECGTSEGILTQCLDCTEDVYRYCARDLDTHTHEVYVSGYDSDYDSGYDYGTSCDSYSSEWDYETPYEES